MAQIIKMTKVTSWSASNIRRKNVFGGFGAVSFRPNAAARRFRSSSLPDKPGNEIGRWNENHLVRKEKWFYRQLDLFSISLRDLRNRKTFLGSVSDHRGLDFASNPKVVLLWRRIVGSLLRLRSSIGLLTSSFSTFFDEKWKFIEKRWIRKMTKIEKMFSFASASSQSAKCSVGIHSSISSKTSEKSKNVEKRKENSSSKK